MSQLSYYSHLDISICRMSPRAKFNEFKLTSPRNIQLSIWYIWSRDFPSQWEKTVERGQVVVIFFYRRCLTFLWSIFRWKINRQGDS